jgi:hypothetical protein
MDKLRTNIVKFYTLIKPTVTFSDTVNPTPSSSALSNVSQS